MQNLLIIGFVWPEPNSSAAGSRMLQLIDLFERQGYTITFACAAAYSEFMFDVTTLGVKKIAIALNDASFDAFVIDLNPTIVLFDRFMTEEQYGWRVAQNCPNAMRILDTEDLHCLRQARHLSFKEKRDFSNTDLFSDVAKREVASILRCDLSLIISEFEMQLLQDFFKVDKALLHYLPLLADALDKNDWPKFIDRKDFVFIGNFLHAPNWNTVQYLSETIWPKIHKQLPEAKLEIYGAYASQKVLQLHKPAENFYIMGRAHDAKHVVKKARVVLAPIRFGAGAKGKLLEAMQCGTPSVTTSMGAESMHGDLPWNGIIADDADEIAKAAVQLYQNEAQWLQSQQNGIAIVNERFLKDRFATTFIEQLFALQQTLQKHRQSNFMGAMLMHHSLASTKFMSKWIEQKNK